MEDKEQPKKQCWIGVDQSYHSTGVAIQFEDKDKIQGLTLGADDYITKPFNILEVKARMKAILRRNAVTEKKAAKRYGGDVRPHFFL